MTAAHPGFKWLVGPTRDWRKAAPDAFVWVVYEPAAFMAPTTCHRGFAPTAEAAKAAALAVLA